MMNYNYEKENFKICPVCGKTIDYHIDGFYHDQVLNVWICRDHTLLEISQHIQLKDEGLIEFIAQGELPIICARCAGKQEGAELEDHSIFELKPCARCGTMTAIELGGTLIYRG